MVRAPLASRVVSRLNDVSPVDCVGLEVQESDHDPA